MILLLASHSPFCFLSIAEFLRTSLTVTKIYQQERLTINEKMADEVTISRRKEPKYVKSTNFFFLFAA